MVNEIEFTIDNEILKSVLKGSFRFTQDRPTQVCAYFDYEGFHIVGVHPEQHAAVLICVGRKHLKEYKRRHDTAKSLKRISQDFLFDAPDLEKLIKFVDIKKKDPVNIKITDKNIIIKIGELKRNFSHTTGDAGETASKLKEILNRVSKSVPHCGYLNVSDFYHYVRSSEVAHRKMYSGEGHRARFIKKNETYQLYVPLESGDEMVCEMKGDIEDAPEQDLEAIINIRELGQGMKYLHKLSKEVHLQLKLGMPSIISATGKSPEKLYQEDLNYWYLLAPIIEEE